VSFKILSQTIGDVTILRPSGKISIGEGDIALRDKIRELIAQGHKKVVLSLGQTYYMDSSGFGELVSMYTNLANAGGRVVLTELTAKIQDILQITQLITVFEVTDTVEEALQLLSLPKSPQG
jgi:anti-sigma B factor antagonist